MTDSFEETRTDITQKFETNLAKNKKSIANIKDSCAKFFNNYDLQ